MTDELGLPPDAFAKMDGEDDAIFYREPRLVTHIDDAAIAALTLFYRSRLPQQGAILDLMSSWVSHLPSGSVFSRVIGHGMNAAELAANPRLDRFFVQDLNREPTLPLESASIDAVLICASIQYLEQPVAVLREAARVLKGGGEIIVSFSNRCFPTKAVAIWRALDIRRQAGLVSLYMEKAGFTGGDVALLVDGSRSDPLVAAVGWK